ncbi:hypothetical protein P3521_03740 [Vibrio parahaemolyticus]|nr:hypothetical protein [Vibrio parahaemolyticus]MDF4668714.1 hypothetical protein [Vibrio parahaemolyticus]HAV1412737.1 hypothetical protein [Vibrio parahaemolyticus]HAV2004819.1 hypothetical protein [Vibrio parahaemolyticus]
MAGIKEKSYDVQTGVIFGAKYDDGVIASGEGEVLELTVLAYDADNDKYLVCDPTADPATSAATVPSCLVALQSGVDATSEDKHVRLLVEGEVDADKVVLKAGSLSDVHVALREKGIIIRKTCESSAL